MTPDPTLALSFAAGVLSFLSPCIVPLVPSYLSFIGGVAANEAGESAASRGVVVLRTALFVAGFTIVFVVLGVVFSGSGALFTSAGRVVNLVAGGVVVVLGLNVIFDFWKVLNIERRYHMSHRPSGHLGSILIGMAFGAGWTPCIGPILASVLLLAGSSGSVATGVLYLVAIPLGGLSAGGAWLGGLSFVASLMWANVGLAVFNMIPAFPMDGGRVFRALLAKRLGYTRATIAAANVGRAFAIAFGIIGFLTSPVLVLVAVFLWLVAGRELQVAKLEQQQQQVAGWPGWFFTPTPEDRDGGPPRRGRTIVWISGRPWW